MSIPSTVRARSAFNQAHWLRLFALLLALLGPTAQQRALLPSLRPSAPVVRLVAQRVQSIETHALRAEPALRLPASPLYVRVPCLAERVVARPLLELRACLASSSADPSRASLSHFHSKRRIPRMNSEEPPRA